MSLFRRLYFNKNHLYYIHKLFDFTERRMKMKKGLTEVVFILDESGSMYELKNDTIGGYNSFLDKQKQMDGECYVSTVLFNDDSKVIHDRVDIKSVKPMTGDDYVPSGSTALLDAVGNAIHHIKNVHKYAREEDVPEKTIFVITTDGMENSSIKYSYDRIKTMISLEQEKYGWEFLFLGANIDAVSEAGKLGIRANRVAKYKCDSVATMMNFEALGKVVEDVRMCKEIASDWNEEIIAYEKQGRKSK